jgi:hypothetical protein
MTLFGSPCPIYAQFSPFWALFVADSQADSGRFCSYLPLPCSFVALFALTCPFSPPVLSADLSSPRFSALFPRLPNGKMGFFRILRRFRASGLAKVVSGYMKNNTHIESFAKV